MAATVPSAAVLRLRGADVEAIVDHARSGVPEEVCGLLAGELGGEDVEVVYRCRNAARSPVVYTLDPLDHLKADRDAAGRGLEIIGVYHSHTHTEAYPSPTDVAQAPDPGWHYVLVSLASEPPVVRSFRIVEGAVTEEELVAGEEVPTPAE